MVLQISGPISSNNIQIEFGGADPIKLSEYYVGATPALVPNGTANSSGGLIPTFADVRPPISFSMFYGTSNKSYNCFFELTPGNLLNFSKARIPGLADNANNVYYSYSENEFSTPSKFQYIMKNNAFGSTATFNDGTTPWKKKYGDPAYNQLNLTGAAISNTGSNIFYGGYRIDNTTGNGVPFLYSANTSTGSKVWEMIISSNRGGEYDPQITAVHYDTFSNNVFIAGKVNYNRPSDGTQFRNTFIKNYSANSTGLENKSIFDKRNTKFGSTDSVLFINSMDVTSNAVYTFGLINNNAALIRYNKVAGDGSASWIRGITGTSSTTDLDFCLAQKSNTNIYVGVSHTSGGVKSEYLNKFNLTGGRDANWIFNNSTGNYVSIQHACINNKNDDYYVVGDLRGIQPNQSYASVFIIKYNSSDVEQWQRTITIPYSSCIAKSVWLTPDGNTVYVNFTYNIGSATLQAVAKLPADGTETGKYTFTGSSSLIWYNECNFITKSLSVAMSSPTIAPSSIAGISGYLISSVYTSGGIAEQSSGAGVTQINAGDVYTFANTIPVSLTGHNLTAYAGPIDPGASAGSAKVALTFNASGNTSWTGNTTNSIAGRYINLDGVDKSNESSATGYISGEWLKSIFKTDGAGANYQIYANNIINSPGNITLTNLTLNTWTTMNQEINITLNSGSRNDTNAAWDVYISDIATNTILGKSRIDLNAMAAGTA